MNRFKISIFAATIAAMSLVACNGDKIADLEKRNSALNEQTTLQDSLLNDFMTSFNTFEDNLAMIKEKENLISMETGDQELAPDQKERILNDIQSINDLLDQNRTLIADLTAKVEKNNGKVGEFRRMVKRLKTDLEARDTEINTMKEELVALNFEKETLNRRVDTLRGVNENLVALSNTQAETIVTKDSVLTEQTETINTQTARLNRAFYVVGTEKELKEKNILSKEGGVIGIGRTAKLATNFDASAFTAVDITEFESIPVETKKVKIVTAHPSDSYAVNETDKGQVESLEITNPDKFWAASRYLVVVLN
ncbi:MAG: hypothetical protein AAFQ87_15235 [Bacteroidota bacterium]